MFRQGKFYAIQARNEQGQSLFVEFTGRLKQNSKLASLATRAAMTKYNPYDDEWESRDSKPKNIKTSQNPFDLHVWKMGDPIQVIIDSMREIRKICGSQGIDPMSLKLVVIQTSVESYCPETPSDDETALRRFVLEKLSMEEQKLLKVEHWSVYNKLADRSTLPPADED
jgi:hypothetical protein